MRQLAFDSQSDYWGLASSCCLLQAITHSCTCPKAAPPMRKMHKPLDQLYTPGDRHQKQKNYNSRAWRIEFTNRNYLGTNRFWPLGDKRGMLFWDTQERPHRGPFLQDLKHKLSHRLKKNLRIKLPYDPTAPLLGIYTEETIIEKIHTHTNVHYNTIYNSSVPFSCSVVSDPWHIDCSPPGFSVLLHVPTTAQTHVHWVDDAIKPFLPLSPPSFNLSQHQGIF